MQEFIVERNNGTDTTTAVDQALMKTFKDASAIDLAIQAGIVNEGEIVATVDDDHPNKLPTDQLREMQEEIRALQEDLGHIDDALPSDISSDNLIASINAVLGVIEGLDVPTSGGAGKYIKAISETDGKIIPVEETLDTTVTQGSSVAPTSGAVYTAIDNASSGASSSLAAAIQALDVAETGGTNKYIKAISETDGKISATEGTVDTVVTLNSGNLITSGAVNSALSASETTLQGNINAVSAKISSTASSSDKCPAASEVTSEINTATGAINDKISSTASSTDKVPAMSEVTSAISTAVGNEATARDTAITNAINALDVSDSAVANQYVSQVSETNGKISVTRTSLPTIATFTLSGTDLIITY